jgi:MFS family permease
MLAAIRGFNLTIWLIIAGTFGGRFVQFMILPFLAILLHQKFGLNELEVGIFLAAASLVGIIFGFYVGYLSDRIGRRKIIIFGVVLTIVAMLALGVADNLYVLFAGTLMQSLARPMVENPGRALMTDTVEDRDVKDMALHMRYFGLNVGAALGPLLGAAAGLTGEQSTFYLVAVVYCAYLIGAIVVFRIEPPARASAAGSLLNLGEVLRVLGRDHPFLLLVLASLICSICYGQTDSALVQYLQIQSVADIASLYAILIAVNAGTIVILQFPLLRLMQSVTLFRRSMFGVILFVFGFVGFAIAPTETPYGLMLAMFVLSVGEAILFPTQNLIIDRIAPDAMKGSYFGAFSLGVLGFAIAPLIGGALLYAFGGLVLWLVTALLASIVALLYYFGGQSAYKDL